MTTRNRIAARRAGERAASLAPFPVFTLAIGCVIVLLMKGPAYVADAYPPPCWPGHLANAQGRTASDSGPSSAAPVPE